MSKQLYIQQITTTATALAQSFDAANALVNVYFDRGYNGGGADELVAEDLAAAGLTVGQVISFITLAQQLQALRNGGAVSSADYDSTLNVLRRDI
jgi:hypothetical protein